ncbi:gamma-glutamyl kinase [uncultured Jannaschia sp.]|uniref:gamma-glutamyl kinase n=1 Tax=uncultured Jannaschia sp. TaxID=293347 RepID=UPI002602DFA6|nr:gamma-glutamyl kinase [uncultured Jannaschia sp.]
MLIFWDARIVLLAVPKTGSTALEAALASHADAAIVNPPGLKHCGVRKYDRELRPFFERGGQRPMEKMAVIREPVDWLGSWFRYRSRPALRGHANSTAGMQFTHFVEAYLTPEPPAFARVGSQAVMLAGGVEHLFRHDDLGPATAFLAERLGTEVTLPRANVSPPGDVSLPADLEARLRIERAEDFALWKRAAP